nr:ORF 1a/1b fusion protein [Tomato infectious chlorosis virus]
MVSFQVEDNKLPLYFTNSFDSKSICQVTYNELNKTKRKITSLSKCILGYPLQLVGQSFKKGALKYLRQYYQLPGCNFNKIPLKLARSFRSPMLELVNRVNEYKLGLVGEDSSAPALSEWKIQGSTGVNSDYVLWYNDDVEAVDVMARNVDVNKSTVAIEWRLRWNGRLNKGWGNYEVDYTRHFNRPVNNKVVGSFALFNPKSVADKKAQCCLMYLLSYDRTLVNKMGIYINIKLSEWGKSELKRVMNMERITGANTNPNKPVTAEQKTILRRGRNQYKNGFFEVALVRDKQKKETFVINSNDGREVRVLNDRNAVKNVFNATLHNKSYVLHPMSFTPSGKRVFQEKEGYCWLDAFSEGGRRIPDNVIPFKHLRVHVLLSCGLGHLLKKHMRKTGNMMYHFEIEPTNKPVTMEYMGFLGAGAMFNGDDDTKDLNLRVDGFIDKVLENTAIRGDNVLMNNILHRASERLNIEATKSKDVQIRVCLDNNEKRMLTRLFPEMSMDFLDSTSSSHALFNAMRQCENYYFHKMMGSRDYIDAGGDIIQNLSEHSNNIHVCSPLVDVRDAKRHMDKSIILDKMRGFSEKLSMCDKLTQDCDHKATNIVAVEVYDMTLQDIARSIQSHGAKRFDLSCIIPPEIVNDDCDVELFDGRLRVTVSGGLAEYFYGNTGETYTHNVHTLRDIMKNQIFVVDGLVFKRTLEKSKDQLHFFSIVPCYDFPSGDYMVSTHYHRSELDKVYVNVPIKDAYGVTTFLKFKEDRSFVHSMVEYVANTSIRVDDKTIEWAISQYRARKTVVIKAGKVSQKESCVPLDLLPGFLATIIAEGIRVREKTHHLARMSYIRHYIPSIVDIVFMLIKTFFTHVIKQTHQLFVDVLRYFFTDKLVDALMNVEGRIEDPPKTMVFQQSFSVFTDTRSKNHILMNSFNHFLDDQIEQPESVADDKEWGEFDDVSLEGEVSELINSGGGANSDFFFYCRMSKLVRTFLPVNQSTKVIDLIMKAYIGIKSKFTALKRKLIDALRYIKSTSMTGLGAILSLLLRELRKPIDWASKKLSNMLKRKIDDCIDDLSSNGISSDPFENPMFSDSSDEELPDLEDIESESNGVISEVQKPRTCYWKNLKQWMKIAYQNIVAWFKDKRKNNTFAKGYNQAVSTLTLILSDVDAFNNVYNLIVSCGVNAALSVVFGNFYIPYYMLQCGVNATLRTGVFGKMSETTILAADTIMSGLADVRFLHPNYMTLKWGVNKMLATKGKIKLKSVPQLKEVCEESIKKDLIGSELICSLPLKAYIWILYALLFIWFLYPAQTTCLLFIAYPLYDYRKYITNMVYPSNIMASYPRAVNRFKNTYNMKQLRKAIREKFSDTKTGNDDQGETEKHPFEAYEGTYEHQTDGKEEIINEGNKPDLIEEQVGKENVGVNSNNFDSKKPTLFKGDRLRNSDIKLCKFLQFYPLSVCASFSLTNDKVVDSIEEFYFLERKKLEIELGKVKNTLHMIQTHGNMISSLRKFTNDKTVYVSSGNNNYYRMSFRDQHPSKEDFKVKFNSAMEMIPGNVITSDVCVTTDEFRGMYSNARCLAIESMFDENNNLVKRPNLESMTFFNKPPGAGKTTEIVNLMDHDLKLGLKTMAFSATKMGCNELKTKLANKGVSQVDKLVRTYDSLLMNTPNVIELDKAYFDEAYMIHSGQFLVCAAKLKYNNLYCYGDVNQLPYINRNPYVTDYHSFSIFEDVELNHDDKTFRCPADVCYLLSNLKNDAGKPLYPRGVKNSNPGSKVIRSCEVEGVNGVNQIEIQKDVKYLTFTQDEKIELQHHIARSGGCEHEVNTVHEAQGCTFPSVALVRLRGHDNPVMSNINQIVVAMSRHTKHFKYFVLHSKLDDKVSSHVKTLKTVADYILKDFMFKQSVDTYSLKMEEWTYPDTLSRAPSSNYHCVSDFMDLCFPGVKAYDYLHRTYMYEYSDYYLPPCEDVNITMSKTRPYRSGKYVVPRIIGKGERNRPDTWKQVLLSLSHRNFNSPMINHRVDVNLSANILLASLKGCLDEEKFGEWYEPILPDLHKMDDWLKSRDGNKYRRLNSKLDYTILRDKFSKLNLMVKGETKPKMDTSTYESYNAPANIIYYQQVVNLYFSPMFLAVFDRLTYCLNDKIILYSGMNTDTLAKLIESKLSADLNDYNTTEIDFSKFDKSQGTIFKIYEKMVYELFKFDQDTYKNIEMSEHFCRVSSVSGIDLELGSQRRTGSPNTWLSNTLATLGMLMSFYKLEDIDLILVSGDDSLIFSRRKLPNVVGEINKCFGMEAKLIENSVAYFCSKYIISDKGKIKVVPDPVRFFEKLSTPVRLDEIDSKLSLRERYISFKDLMRGYDLDGTVMMVDALVCYRHKLPVGASYAALTFIHCLLSNFMSFMRIYELGETVDI